MDSEQQMILALWATGGFSLILFILALTNKVVVFINGIDLFTTLSIGLAPILMFIILASLDIPYTTNELLDFKLPEGEMVGKVVVVIGLLTSLFCFIKTFINSMKYNNPIVGILIGVFKILAIGIVFLSIFAVFYGQSWSQNKRGMLYIILMVLILGIFIWIGRTLINGDRVLLARQNTIPEN